MHALYMVALSQRAALCRGLFEGLGACPLHGLTPLTQFDPVFPSACRYARCMNAVELDFLSKLLQMDPAARMTGDQCLQHAYLRPLWEAEHPSAQAQEGSPL